MLIAISYQFEINLQVLFFILDFPEVIVFNEKFLCHYK